MTVSPFRPVTLVFLLAVSGAGTCWGQDVPVASSTLPWLPPDPNYAPAMATLQAQLDEARRQQAADVMDSPEQVQLEEVRIVDIQREMSDLAMRSVPDPTAALITLNKQQNIREFEGQMNAAQADALDDDTDPY